MSRKVKNIANAAAGVADALVKQLRDAAGDFFSRSAHDLVVALIMYRCIKKAGGCDVPLETARAGQRVLSRPLHR
jgi:hypothetical protein